METVYFCLCPWEHKKLPLLTSQCQKLLDIHHTSSVIISCSGLSAPILHSNLVPNHFFSYSEATLNLTLGICFAFYISMQKTWSMQTDGLSILTFKHATNCWFWWCFTVVAFPTRDAPRCTPHTVNVLFISLRWVVSLWMALRGQQLIKHH